VQLLLDANANINHANNRMVTPLWFAKDQGFDDIADLLSGMGAIEDPFSTLENIQFHEAVATNDVNVSKFY